MPQTLQDDLYGPAMEALALAVPHLEHSPLPGRVRLQNRIRKLLERANDANLPR